MLRLVLTVQSCGISTQGLTTSCSRCPDFSCTQKLSLKLVDIKPGLMTGCCYVSVSKQAQVQQVLVQMLISFSHCAICTVRFKRLNPTQTVDFLPIWHLCPGCLSNKKDKWRLNLVMLVGICLQSQPPCNLSQIQGKQDDCWHAFVCLSFHVPELCMPSHVYWQVGLVPLRRTVIRTPGQWWVCWNHTYFASVMWQAYVCWFWSMTAESLLTAGQLTRLWLTIYGWSSSWSLPMCLSTGTNILEPQRGMRRVAPSRSQNSITCQALKIQIARS